MKSRHVIGMIIGAVIGTLLGYLGTGSVSAFNLSISAFVGALVGLYFVTAASMPAGRRSGVG